MGEVWRARDTRLNREVAIKVLPASFAYIVAELLEGEELREQLNEGALPVRRSIEYAQQIAAGLAAAHEKSIVHRERGHWRQGATLGACARAIAKRLAQCKLELHPEKTRIVYCKDG